MTMQNKNRRITSFENPEQLVMILKTGNIFLTNLQLKELYTEINAGDCYLEFVPSIPDSLRRYVKVVQVIIHKGSKVLIETREYDPHRGYKTINRPLSGKIRPTELLSAATKREICEELAIETNRIVTIISSAIPTSKEHPSHTFNNILTHYYSYVVHAFIRDLPNGEFSTVEQPNSSTETERIHEWVWVTWVNRNDINLL